MLNYKYIYDGGGKQHYHSNQTHWKHQAWLKSNITVAKKKSILILIFNWFFCKELIHIFKTVFYKEIPNHRKGPKLWFGCNPIFSYWLENLEIINKQKIFWCSYYATLNDIDQKVIKLAKLWEFARHQEKRQETNWVSEFYTFDWWKW